MNGRITTDGDARPAIVEGFSLIELIVVVAVISILAAVAVPVVDLVQSRARGEATQAGMEALGQALESYFTDQLSFPPKLQDLEESGYLAGGFSSGYVLKDAGAAPFGYRANDARATVTSYGPDKAEAEPNLDLVVDGTRFLLARTRDDLQTIHTSLRNYESRRMLDSLPALPAVWYQKEDPKDSALGILIQRGFLPNTTRYSADAWGDVYDYGGSPADYVRSKHLNVAAMVAGAGGSVEDAP